MGWKLVDLSSETGFVRFEKAGLELDLGSVGKGFALDHAANMLQNSDFGKVIIHAGHSSIRAIGDMCSPGGGWMVSLRHPLDPEQDLVSLYRNNKISYQDAFNHANNKKRSVIRFFVADFSFGG